MTSEPTAKIESRSKKPTAIERVRAQRDAQAEHVQSEPRFRETHYDSAYQSQAITALVCCPEFKSTFGDQIGPKYFANTSYEAIAEAAFEYWERYDGPPQGYIVEKFRAEPETAGDKLVREALLGIEQQIQLYVEGKMNSKFFIDGAKEYFTREHAKLKVQTYNKMMGDNRPDLAHKELLKELTFNNDGKTMGRPTELVWQSEIELKPPVWLVQGLFERGQLIVLTGPFSTGKSFLALDWCKSMAAGIDTFDGRKTMQGKAVYIYSEGIVGFKRRMDAWDFAREQEGKADFPVYPGSIAITDSGEIEFLIKMIDKALPDEPPIAIVIDTLHRNFGAGGNDITKEMRTFSDKCDVLRRRYDCTVIVIHHPPIEHGKSNSGKRPAGSAVLENNADASYYVEETSIRGTYTVSSRKPLKDGECPKPFSYNLTVVGLGEMDEDGNYLTSCVASPTEYVQPGKPSTGKKQMIIKLLEQGDMTHEAIAKNAETSRQYVSKIAKGISGCDE